MGVNMTGEGVSITGISRGKVIFDQYLIEDDIRIKKTL